MERCRVESRPVAIALEEPVIVSGRTPTHRDRAITDVRPESGPEGPRYAFERLYSDGARDVLT
ncbi:hypothetical protein [Natronorubrum sp. DTA28]|uniref:hypothetical protein n=1 Tax=Natronorubrum sp. DTA28 TaxID=3447019 RepID=UPI003F85FEFA